MRTRDGFKLGFGAAFGVLCALLLIAFGWQVYVEVVREMEMRSARQRADQQIVTIGADRGRVMNAEEWQEFLKERDRAWEASEQERKAKAEAEAAERQRIAHEENLERGRRLKEEDDLRAAQRAEQRRREEQHEAYIEQRLKEAREREAARLQAIEDAKYRRWTSDAGGLTREAKIVSYSQGQVTLETRDGKRAKIAVEKLSDADRELIDAWRESRR